MFGRTEACDGARPRNHSEGGDHAVDASGDAAGCGRPVRHLPRHGIPRPDRGGRVSPETRTRVLEPQPRCDTRPTVAPANLRRARAGSIGLWLPAGMTFMEYYMKFAAGVVESTKDRETTVTLIPGDFPAAKAGACTSTASSWPTSSGAMRSRARSSRRASGRRLRTGPRGDAGSPGDRRRRPLDRDARTARSTAKERVAVLRDRPAPRGSDLGLRSRHRRRGMGGENGAQLAFVDLTDAPSGR